MIDPQRTSHPEPTFRDCGDTALLVDFGAAQDRLLASRIYDLSQKLTARNLAGFSECVPAFSTLTVYYDPLQIERHAIEDEVLALWRKAAAGGFKRRRWIVPVCYGGARGEDLQSVSELANLSSKQVIEIHSSTNYFVYMLGFLPGFAYLGDLAEPLRLPRRTTPRPSLPAGSVAIASSMTAIYPVSSPGGWHLIGFTPILLWDLKRAERPLLSPGDEVRFQPVSEEEVAELERQVAAGWMPASEVIS